MRASWFILSPWRVFLLDPTSAARALHTVLTTVDLLDCLFGDRPGISTAKSRLVVQSGHDKRCWLLRLLVWVPASLTGLGGVLISVHF